MTPSGELSADHLSCAYGKRVVVENLSLRVRPGTILVLLGPNGAGKTTLLRALTGLLRPTAGFVLLEGDDISRLPRARIAKQLAFVPQTEHADLPMTVEEAVLLGRTPHRGWLLPFSPEDRLIAQECMRKVGVEALRDRPITQLSGGETRRVILARALAQQPAILLLDEPTTHLDLRYQWEILGLVGRLAHEHGLAVVLTLHDLNQAAVCADQIALLSAGKLAAWGTPAEVFRPEVLTAVYQIQVDVSRHPLFGTPFVSPANDPKAGGGPFGRNSS